MNMVLKMQFYGRIIAKEKKVSNEKNNQSRQVVSPTGNIKMTKTTSNINSSRTTKRTNTVKTTRRINKK